MVLSMLYELCSRWIIFKYMEKLIHFIKNFSSKVKHSIFCFFFLSPFRPFLFFFLLHFICLFFFSVFSCNSVLSPRSHTAWYETRTNQPCYGSWLSGVDRSRGVIDDIQLVAYRSYRTEPQSRSSATRWVLALSRCKFQERKVVL